MKTAQLRKTHWCQLGLNHMEYRIGHDLGNNKNHRLTNTTYSVYFGWFNYLKTIIFYCWWSKIIVSRWPGYGKLLVFNRNFRLVFLLDIAIKSAITGITNVRTIFIQFYPFFRCIIKQFRSKLPDVFVTPNMATWALELHYVWGFNHKLTRQFHLFFWVRKGCAVLLNNISCQNETSFLIGWRNCWKADSHHNQKPIREE